MSSTSRFALCFALALDLPSGSMIVQSSASFPNHVGLDEVKPPYPPWIAISSPGRLQSKLNPQPAVAARVLLLSTRSLQHPQRQFLRTQSGRYLVPCRNPLNGSFLLR